MKYPKIMIFGLDGGTFTIIKPLIKAGKLPNLARLLEEGCHGDLRSTIHPITPHAWTSFMTGKNAGKHGIYDFFERRVGSYDLNYSSNTGRRSKTLWRLLSDYGKRVGLLNVPMTYPPEEIDGFIISGLGTPGKTSEFTYPAALKEDILQKFGDYRLLDFDARSTQEDYIKFQHEAVNETIEVSKYLLEKYEMDVFMVVFMGTDQLQHIFWHCQDQAHPMFNQADYQKYGNVIADIYEKVDWALGEFCKMLPADTQIIIISDHGFGPTKKIIYLSKWLEENELLYFKETFGTDTVLRKGIGTVRAALDHYLPRKWKYELKKLFPFLQGQVDSYLTVSDVDWSKTKAYSWGNYGNIIINLKGRESQGIVNPGQEYNDLCQNITERLYQLKDPETNEKVVEKVYRKEELYHGDFLEKAPDLVAVYKDYAYYTPPLRKLNRDKKIFEVSYGQDDHCNLKILSHHRLNGIFFLQGQGIKPKQEMQGVNIIDVAPTILYLLNLPIPEDIDGRVLQEAFEDHVIHAQQVRYTKDVDERRGAPDSDEAFSEAEKKEIEDRLKGLGYLE